MPVETNPDDPIIKLPMETLCLSCGRTIASSTANWPKSHVDNIIKLLGDSWTGVVISHGYCSEHASTPQKPSL